MLQTIQGIYKNGKIELTEIPQNISVSQVIVTFLAPQMSNPVNSWMSFGMFAGVQQSKEADFQEAEFHDDADDVLNWA